MILALCKAVNARWREAMPAGLPLHDEDGPSMGTPVPYARFSPPDSVPEYSFGGLSCETVMVHFDIYAQVRVEALGYFENLKAAFDDASFPVEGFELLKMERDGFHRAWESGAWRVIVPYTVQLQPL